MSTKQKSKIEVSSGSDSVLVSTSDIKLISEFVLFAAESMQEVIDWEVASGRDRPIVQAMREYVRDAKALLTRLP